MLLRGGRLAGARAMQRAATARGMAGAAPKAAAAKSDRNSGAAPPAGRSIPPPQSPTALPSTTTTIRLSRLAASVTEDKLREGMEAAKVGCRRVLLEPGCAILFRNEAEADFAAQSISSKFSGTRCLVQPTSMASLLLQNLPDSVTAQSLESAFGSFNPKSVQLAGGASVRVTVQTAEKALAAKALLEGKGSGVRVRVTRLSSDYLLEVFNLPAGAKAEEQAAEVTKLLQPVLGAAGAPVVIPTSAAAGSAVVRYSAARSPDEARALAQKQLEAAGLASVSVLGAVRLKQPCLSIRRIEDEAVLQTLLNKDTMPKPHRILSRRRSPDAPMDQAVVFYRSESDAFRALAALRGVSVGGQRLGVAYRELSPPVVVVSGLAAGATTEEVTKLFAGFAVQSVEMRPLEASAVVCLQSPKEVIRACAALSRKIGGGGGVGGMSVRAGHDEGCDVGVELSVPPSSSSAAKLWPAVSAPSSSSSSSGSSGGPSASSVAFRSNRQAVVAFETSEQAVAALEGFLAGKVALTQGQGQGEGEGEGSGGLVSARVSVLPSFAVSVRGLGVDVPASSVEQHLAAAASSLALSLDPLRTERSALLKFKRHREVVPALKVLAGPKVLLDGQVRAERFRPLVPIGDSDYDRLYSGADGSAEAEASSSGTGSGKNMTPEELDQFSLRTLLADFMSMDPGMRYQLARNAFERALVDAKARNDISMLLADKECSAAMQEEAKALLTQTPTRATNARLFELFLQREDMLAFSHDFAEMRAYLGPDGPTEGGFAPSSSSASASASDPYDWSRFQITDGEELRALQVEMAEADARALAGVSSGGRSRGLGKSGGSTLPDGTMPSSSSSIGGKNLLLVDGTGDEEPVAVSLEDPSSLMDKDGRLWSGAILDTDMVQKTMPGNRVNSHRALVVVGNMRGAAGFGMGKGKTTGDAVNAAFRDALRHLEHIDLFDNFGLAHDLHGHHNSCHAYIRATPRSRAIVGSPFATAVLTRFGVGSASVKLVGRRDPYAMVRALFNAIKQHENVDEFAKDRGKRYLSLRWAYDQNL